MITEATCRIISHEVAHAILAHMLGLRVVYTTRDPRDAGQTCAVFRDDDTRSLKEVAFARAVLTIGAVWYECGLVDGEALFCADSDVQKASMLADAAGFDLLEAAAYARDLFASEQFRTLHSRLFDAMMHKVHLDERELARLLR